MGSWISLTESSDSTVDCDIAYILQKNILPLFRYIIYMASRGFKGFSGVLRGLRDFKGF